MAAAVFWHGPEVRTLERIKQTRPYESLPTWLVGMLVLMFRDSRHPAPRQTATLAWEEWRRRHSSGLDVADEDVELWLVTIELWHDMPLADLATMMVLPKGTHLTRSEYVPRGDMQRVLVKIPRGTKIEVLDSDRVCIERVM